MIVTEMQQYPITFRAKNYLLWAYVHGRLKNAMPTPHTTTASNYFCTLHWEAQVRSEVYLFGSNASSRNAATDEFVQALTNKLQTTNAVEKTLVQCVYLFPPITQAKQMLWYVQYMQMGSNSGGRNTFLIPISILSVVSGAASQSVAIVATTTQY